jgi:acetyl-CoA carboxylase carboxyl transferase subunit beta
MELLTQSNPTFTGWSKCACCKEILHEIQVCKKTKVCPKCNFHFLLTAEQRIAITADEGSFTELFVDIEAKDLLGFFDTKSYKNRLEEIKNKTNKGSSITTGTCLVYGEKIALAVMDFSFMGGSLGRAEGEKLTLLVEYATKESLPLVIFSASGGARMQESMFSLLQMAKTSAALKRHAIDGGFTLSILTNPTMGGVLASFASLGDIILAEPKALIGFAGPRVIEQTIGKKLEDNDQRSEFQLEHGMIDQIVERSQLKNRILYFIKMFQKRKGSDGKG